MKTNNPQPYPSFSKDEIIDLFLLVACRKLTRAREEHPGGYHQFMFMTFDYFQSIVGRLRLILESRLVKLFNSPEFYRLFVNRTFFADPVYAPRIEEMVEKEDKRPFAALYSSDEVAAGLVINRKDLFSLRRIYITRRGFAIESIVSRALSGKVSVRDIEVAIWEKATASIPHAAHAKYRQGYADWCRNNEEGERSWKVRRRVEQAS